MTRMLDLIADTRRLAYGSMADQLNFLAVDYLFGDGELTMVMDVANITPGMVLSSGLNVWYVVGTDAATKRVMVYSSYQNSRNDPLSVGAPVMIRPRVTDWLLFSYVNDAIKAMSSPTHGLYREGQWESPADSIWWTYDIPAEAQSMTSLLRVSVRYPTSTDSWYEVPMTSVEWQPENNVIRLKVPVPNSTSVRFDYRAPFVPATDLTDDVDTVCGLSDSLLDIPPLGAAARLLRTTESRRNQIHSQSDSRRAEEVQSGGNTDAARQMQREFEDRVAQERIRLVNRNPYTLAWPR